MTRYLNNQVIKEWKVCILPEHRFLAFSCFYVFSVYSINRLLYKQIGLIDDMLKSKKSGLTIANSLKSKYLETIAAITLLGKCARR